jgi:hypothetical protein
LGVGNGALRFDFSQGQMDPGSKRPGMGRQVAAVVQYIVDHSFTYLKEPGNVGGKKIASVYEFVDPVERAIHAI